MLISYQIQDNVFQFIFSFNNTHKSCHSSYYRKGIDELPNFFLYPKKTFNRAIEHLLFLLELFGLLRVWFYRVIMFPGEPAIGRKEFACDASGKCFCKLPFVLDSNRGMEQSWKHSLKWVKYVLRLGIFFWRVYSG